MPPGDEDNQGGGQDIPGQLAPRGARQPWLDCPLGGKLSRGQDKLGHWQINIFAMPVAFTGKYLQIMGNTGKYDLQPLVISIIEVI